VKSRTLNLKKFENALSKVFSSQFFIEYSSDYLEGYFSLF